MDELEPQWENSKLSLDQIKMLNASEDNRRATIEAMSVGDANILHRKLAKEIERLTKARQSAERAMHSIRSTLLSH